VPHESRNNFRRDADCIERDVRAAHLRAQGWPYHAIATELGFAHKSTAYRAVQRVCQQIQVEAADELRKVEGLRLTMLIAKACALIEDPPDVVSNGQRITGLPDARVVIAAIREARQLSESFRRLMGLDAPSRAEVRVTDDLTAEIEQLAVELARADRSVAGRSAEGAAGPATS